MSQLSWDINNFLVVTCFSLKAGFKSLNSNLFLFIQDVSEESSKVFGVHVVRSDDLEDLSDN